MSVRSRLIDDPALLRARLAATSTGPGVYLFRDPAGRVAYVGKAANVQSRLRSYFTGRGAAGASERLRLLVGRVVDFEVVDCLNEREALILENTLIKHHRPRFNIRLKDDKNYLYLKVPRAGSGSGDTLSPGTAREHVRPRRRSGSGPDPSRFPRPFYTRRLGRDGARYYGPYTTAQSLRTTVRSLRTVLPFRTCGDEVFRRGRVCLDYHIKRCSGPCEGRIDDIAYNHLLDQVQLFMEGRSELLATQLRDQMDAAAARLDFELAARHRDRLDAMRRLGDTQKMLRGRGADEDVIAVALEGEHGMVAVVSIREGRVMGVDNHELAGVAGMRPGECLAAFVTQFYETAVMVPRTITVSEPMPGREVIEAFLDGQRGMPGQVRVGRRGRTRGLVEQARTTALSTLRQRRIVEDFDGERTEALLADLATRLGLPEPPRRIECYDISNTMGTNSVGSMIVFEEGRPRPDHYRHFGIRSVEGADDVASMAELLRRRFRRYLGSAESGPSALDGDIPVMDPAGSNGALTAPPSPPAGDTLTGKAVAEGVDGWAVAEGSIGGSEGGGSGGRRHRSSLSADDSFTVLPDLIVVDGGRGQLAAAQAVARDAGLDEVPIVGLAKRNEEIHTAAGDEPVIIPRDSPTLFLVQRIRDEAHRFAITRHRARRGRSALRSRLDSVPGLGPVRRRALLRTFGSIDGIRAATVEQLSAVPGVPRGVALSIKELV